ncbi:Uma2 family endonuclease [Streptomyces sp. NPDC055103]
MLLIAEVVSVSSARKDYDDCTAKYGRYGIPVYLVVNPYVAEVVVHTQPTETGCIAAHTHQYGTGKLPIDLAGRRTFALDRCRGRRPSRGGRKAVPAARRTTRSHVLSRLPAGVRRVRPRLRGLQRVVDRRDARHRRSRAEGQARRLPTVECRPGLSRSVRTARPACRSRCPTGP